MKFSEIFILKENIFKKFLKIFSRKKKIPSSDKYPYFLIDSYSIFGEKNRYQKFFLVGSNWNNNKDLPIAIVIGCNNWKFGFISDYLKGYRVAFLGRKITGLRAIKRILTLNERPSNLFIWGYTENIIFSIFIKLKKIFNYKISRIEDGFIRSSELGALHATPYSLVFDKRGLYFNSYKESDLEYLLNNYNLDYSSELINKSKELLELIVNEKLSKYNPADTFKKFKIKIKKTIAVLGQIDSDLSIKYGNPDNWKIDDLINLALSENPDAEILYRPHPEVYKKYQRSKFNERKFQDFLNLKVIDPKENFSDFIENVDHVYTITSLTGFEALMRNKKVTLVGAPFYAGWGLTDDRSTKNLRRRKRKRNLLELFIISYLIYPKYLANSKDPYQGLFAAICRIKGDQKIIENDIFQEKFYSGEDEDLYDLISSKYFVKALFSNKHFEKALSKFSKINFGHYLKPYSSKLFQKIFILSIFGILKKNNLQNEFLRKVRHLIPTEVFYHILLLIYKHRNGLVFEEQLLWLSNQDSEFKIDPTFSSLISSIKNKLQLSELPLNIKKSISPDKIRNITDELFESRRFDQINLIYQLKDSLFEIEKEINEQLILYTTFKDERNLEKAFDVAIKMMINGKNTLKIISYMAEFSRLRFDFSANMEIAQLIQNIDFNFNKRSMWAIELLSWGSQYIKQIGEFKATCELAKVIAIRPDIISLVPSILDKYKYHEYKDTYEIIVSTLLLDNEHSLRKAQAFISIFRPDIALSIIENLISSGQDKQYPLTDFSIMYAQALSYSDRLKEALEIIENLLESYPVKKVLMEAIRLYIADNDYISCKKVLDIAVHNNITLGDMYYRKTYFGSRELKKAFESFSETPVRKYFFKYYKEKYFEINQSTENLNSLCILAIFGPGDEIRFASIYEKIIKLFPNTKLFITCLPKLEKLLKRSFPIVNFVPAERFRKHEFDYSLAFVEKHFSQVKGFDLMPIMDNNAAIALENSDKGVLITDFLPKFLSDYSSFKGTSYLVADPDRVKEFRKILPENKILIGLSWRSSLATNSRNEHYLSIQELEPLFKIKDLIFVNCQYDECSEELEWAQSRYPGKLINIDHLDQMDDLDGVAAMLKCLDLVIAPATTVAEISGSLGCPTWLFSNSSEIDWRKKDSNKTDTWHNSVTIVDLEEKGDKNLLVKEIYEKLIIFSSKFK